MGRRQAVRHWVLVPAFAGSNPADPANFTKENWAGEQDPQGFLPTQPRGLRKRGFFDERGGERYLWYNEEIKEVDEESGATNGAGGAASR